MKPSCQKKSNNRRLKSRVKFISYEPYRILIDPSFCRGTEENKAIVEGLFERFLRSNVTLLTTQCIILEAESLRGTLVGASETVKKFPVLKCSHQGSPVTSAECIKSLVKKHRFIVATQNRTLQQMLKRGSLRSFVVYWKPQLLNAMRALRI